MSSGARMLNCDWMMRSMRSTTPDLIDVSRVAAQCVHSPSRERTSCATHDDLASVN